MIEKLEQYVYMKYIVVAYTACAMYFYHYYAIFNIGERMNSDKTETQKDGPQKKKRNKRIEIIRFSLGGLFLCNR